jgi:putative effector of murein hydrolase LrgA (UPF0299 family)
MDSCSSFSIVNFMCGCSSLISLSVCSTFVFCFLVVICHEYVISISKVSNYLLLELDILFVPCVVYVPASIGDVGAPMANPLACL